jgi:ribosomal protein S18 acetylase RimI-like enzyme
MSALPTSAAVARLPCGSRPGTVGPPGGEPAENPPTWAVLPVDPTRPVTVDTQPWMAQLRKFRARVLYDNGLRPRFRDPSGEYVDPDPLDRHALHIVASAEGELVGCIRLIPMRDTPPATIAGLLGQDGLRRVFSVVGAQPSDSVEVGGWAVAPQHRRSGLGIELAASAVALARKLGFRWVLGAVGTKDGQDRLLTGQGMRPVQGLEPVPLPGFADQVRIMAFETTTDGSSSFRALVATLSARLA